MKAKDLERVILPEEVFVGDKNAPVTLMEFGEYENEDCAKANEMVKQILDKYPGKVKFNFRHFPQTKIHQKSMKASEAAIGACQNGKFWELHNVLFANRRNLGTTSLKLHAREAGIVDKHFLDNLLDCSFGNYVMADYHQGLNKGVTSVPSFFINGKMFTGKLTVDGLTKEIDDALKTATKGTKAKAVTGKKRAA
jgi:protein-disulfide isomerase